MNFAWRVRSVLLHNRAVSWRPQQSLVRSTRWLSQSGNKRVPPAVSNVNAPGVKDEPEEKKKVSFKDMVARHGPVFLVYWGSAWVFTGGLIYLGIETKGPETAMKVVQAVGLDQVLPLQNLDPKLGNIALAVALNEALELVRFPFVIATTPKLTSFVERVTGRSMSRKPGKFATMMAEHGVFFLGYWFVAWGITGLGCYAGVTSFGPEAAIDLFRTVHLDQLINLESIDPDLGNLAIALLINEAIEPIRLPVVIATLPLLKRLLRRQ